MAEKSSSPITKVFSGLPNLLGGRSQPSPRESPQLSLSYRGRGSKVSYLAEIDILRDLSPDEMAWLDSVTTMISCPPGRIIYSQEEPGEILFLLKKGKVQIYRLTPEGRKLEIALLGPGTIFGEMSLVGQHMYNNFAEAVEDSAICVMSREDVERLILSKPQVALRLLEVVGKRLEESETRLEDLAFKSVPGRLASLLLRLAENRGGVITGLTHNDLAEMVGAYRETVTKILNEFKEQGLVELGRKRITILDLAGLQEVSQHL